MNLVETKMIVSTIPEFATNLLLVDRIRLINKKAIIITISHNIEEARELYKKGATYVIMPHFLGGIHASKMIDEYKFDLSKFLGERERHIKYLKNKKRLGHEHPRAPSGR